VRACIGRTRVENNILYKLRHRLLGVTVHCGLAYWQVVSSSSPRTTPRDR